MTEKVPSLSPGRGTLTNKWVPKPKPMTLQEEFAQTVRVPSYGEGDLAKSSYNFYSGWKILFTVFLALFSAYVGEGVGWKRHMEGGIDWKR